jgi:hypothetical protein
VTKEISVEKQTGISKIIPLLKCMNSALGNAIMCTSIGKEFKEILQNNFLKRFCFIEKSKLIAMTTILDPRFKKLHFESPTSCSSAIMEINLNINKMLSNNANISPSPVSPTRSSSEDIWAFHDRLVNDRINSQEDSFNEINLSLRQYLQLPVIERSENPIAFWIRNKLIYPELYKLVVKYFSIIATSVPSERVFSKAGNTINCKRNLLDPNRVEKLIIMSNLNFSEWV